MSDMHYAGGYYGYVDAVESFYSANYGMAAGYTVEHLDSTTAAADVATLPTITEGTNYSPTVTDIALGVALTSAMESSGETVAVAVATGALEGAEVGAWVGPLGGVVGAVIGGVAAYYLLKK